MKATIDLPKAFSVQDEHEFLLPQQPKERAQGVA